jgi:hypothetical protein
MGYTLGLARRVRTHGTVASTGGNVEAVEELWLIILFGNGVRQLGCQVQHSQQAMFQRLRRRRLAKASRTAEKSC